MFWKRRRYGASVQQAPVPGQRKRIWRRRLRWLGTVLIIVGSGVGIYQAGQTLLDPVRFPLRHVHIEGELRNLDKAEVRQLVQGYLGQNFFTVDVNALHGAFAASPWIEYVAVRRLWPDSLVVRFQERTAFGWWGQDDEMVDTNGQRFRPSVIRQPGPWPRLMGPDGHEKTLIQVYQEANAMVAKVGLEITGLIQDERRAWWLTFDNGIEVSVGREHFGQRLQRFVDVYPEVLSGLIDRIAVVDLRYINGFAVRWSHSPVMDENGLRSPAEGTPARVRISAPMVSAG